ncbi:MAG: hypothetical protein GF307_11425 [candidate division Zixibacteria bacterium]|nr:hypothetical protein [candidate division Zixibacteria bacterium]
MSPAAECRDLATHCKGLGARQMSPSAADKQTRQNIVKDIVMCRMRSVIYKSLRGGELNSTLRAGTADTQLSLI